MNKAFMREPDATDELCPRCGAAGLSVSRELIAKRLPPGATPNVAERANFCATPTCPVAYFDAFERMVLATELAQTVYPKDPDAPICACFGLTCDDIDQDIREGGVARTRACVQRAQSSEARCAECSPDGRSCVSVIQRYYFQRKSGKA